MARALTTLLMLALHGAALAGPVPAADAVAPTPPGSALAAEMIKEAEAGAAATDAPRTPRHDSALAMAAARR